MGDDFQSLLRTESDGRELVSGTEIDEGDSINLSTEAKNTHSKIRGHLLF